MKTDLYQRITADIIAAIEAGVGACRTPWHLGSSIEAPASALSNRPYRGINTLLLWAEAGRRGFASGGWGTFRQWAQLGAQVRRSERATMVLLWKPVEQRSAGKRDDDEDRRHTVARAFHVFNADQVDGYEPGDASLSPSSRIARADAFFRAQPAEIWDGGDTAFYDLRADIISMPSVGAFSSLEAYCSVLAHELTHWSGREDPA